MQAELFDIEPTEGLVAGCDEVGRGPLAGDVVAAAVILPIDHGLIGLNDSKKLTANKREQLYEQILTVATAYSIQACSPAEIDQLNILQASLAAMHKAVDALAVKPAKVLVDGNKLPRWPYVAKAIVGGDGKYACIAAASILAKVYRDRQMVRAAECYPHYGFEQHKGYPTKAHMAALQRHGACDLHRRSFAPVRRVLSPTV